jgi:photosystem II stability/assembly factor-like uncharacterized protein
MRRSSRRAAAALVIVVAIATLTAGCGSPRSTAGVTETAQVEAGTSVGMPEASTQVAITQTASVPDATATALFEAINRKLFGHEPTLVPGTDPLHPYANVTYPPATPYPPWIVDASFITPSEGWAIRRESADLWHTTDAGAHWSHVGSVGFTPQYVAFRDAQHGLIMGVRQPDCYDRCEPAAAKTSDGGRTWIDVTPPGVAIDLSFSGSVARVHVRECQSPCTSGSVVRLNDYTSSDDGASWQEGPLPTDTNQRCTKTAPGLDTVFWLDSSAAWEMCVGVAGNTIFTKQLFATTDGGATWHLLAETGFGLPPTPPPGVGDLPGPFVTVLLFRDANNGWIGTDEPGTTLQRTRDGAHTWQPVVGETRVQRIEFISDNDGYVVMHYGLWWTSDGGDHWQKLPMP